jgi:hypothetical protein
MRNFGTTMASVASGLSGIASFGFALNNLFTVMNDENMSGW